MCGITHNPKKTCGVCSNYQPSQYEPKQGAGMCKFMVDWLNKHKEAGTKPGPKKIDEVYKTLGGKAGDASAICRPDAERDGCQRFERLG